MRKAFILGEEYSFDYRKKEDDVKLRNCDGYCDETVKLCIAENYTVPDEMCKGDLNSYSRKVMRHEIVHAFLFESGLGENCEWAKNEEVVDWIAIQFPKLLKVMRDVDCI